MNVSIKDIAEAAGVSHSTGSRAPGESPPLSRETKTRIWRPGREKGYSPYAQTHPFVVGRTLTIGLLATTMAEPIIAEYVQATESTGASRVYGVILASSGAEPGREVSAVYAEQPGDAAVKGDLVFRESPRAVCVLLADPSAARHGGR